MEVKVEVEVEVEVEDHRMENGYIIDVGIIIIQYYH